MAKSGSYRGLIGAVAFVCLPTLALAAPKAAAPAAGGAPSTTATGVGGGAATAPATSAAPTAAPSDVPPAPPAPPADGSAPPADAAPAAPPADAAPPAAEGGPRVRWATDGEEPTPRKHKKKKKKRRHVEEDESEDAEAAEDDDHWAPAEEGEVAAESGGWHAAKTRFILSAERLTTISGWSVTETRPSATFSNGSVSSTTDDFETSGTDVSFLGAGSSINPYAVPRLGFDGRFSNGFTLGGSLSYLVRSTKQDVTSGTNGSKINQDGPTNSIFVFAPRLGVFFEASPNVSVWLRGGITRVSVSQEADSSTNGSVTTTSATDTYTFLAVTAEPMLVFTPVPHVGITLSGTLDFGASGTRETTGRDDRDVKASSYGVNAGLAALF